MTVRLGAAWIFMAGVLSGCAGNPAAKVQWVTKTATDKFSDVTSCTVTMGSLYTRQSAYDFSNRFYPFVSKVGGETRVGVRSGGSVRIPVGDVQIRIDQHPAITISTSDTPIDLAPQQTIPSSPVGLSIEQRQIVESSYASSMASISKVMSPYTATSGKKAADLISQMKAGKKLIYRTIGLNQAASTTGEVIWTARF